MKVYLSSDHGGFDVKNKITKYLDSYQFRLEFFEKAKEGAPEIIDLGPKTYNPDDDYPDYAIPLAEKVAQEAGSAGILICRSGNGMAISANKVKGVRAAFCFTEAHAMMAKKDDFANILCLDADYEASSPAEKIVFAFLSTDYASWDTKYGRRVRKLINYEEYSILDETIV